MAAPNQTLGVLPATAALQSVTLAGHLSLIQSTAGCAVTTTTGGQFNVLGRVQPLQNTGGPTFTTGRWFASLALDTADPNDCPAEDQRQVEPPFGPGCDLGAFAQAGSHVPIVIR